MELPQYTVYVETPRLLFPKTLKLIFFGLLFYLGIWLNFFFLREPVPFFIMILVMIAIILVILISTIFYYTKFSVYQYRFFMNRIEFYGEASQMIYYSQIQSMQVKKNFFDVLFGTGTIDLGSFKVKSVPNLNQVFFYVQKMFQMYGVQNQQQGFFQQQFQPSAAYIQQPVSQQNFQRRY